MEYRCRVGDPCLESRRGCAIVRYDSDTRTFSIFFKAMLRLLELKEMFREAALSSSSGIFVDCTRARNFVEETTNFTVFGFCS